MGARLHRLAAAAAAGAGHVVRVSANVLPALIGVGLASTGVAWWLHQPGAGLTVAGVLLLSDRLVRNLPRRGEEQ